MLDQDPTATPAEVRAALQSSAVGVGLFGPCAVGAGLVEAVGAIEDLISPPSFTPGKCQKPAPEGSVEEAQAPGNWGLEVPPPPPPSGPAVASVTTTAADSPPRTFFRKHPPRVIRTTARRARAIFRFGSNETGVTFICKIDTGLFRVCAERLARRFSLGSHVVRVRARDAAGNVDPTPAVFRFRVKQVD